ncbi:hypothetical protein BDF20DRAFT_589080 [Mycotypha africana]|uniref:uncharacterized protein n=1 Tax=Mycotypha africana TaxID=64632 RepID=UPI002301DE76|nr:uncharacterized protein BDF20DRAFT_589080 [Mycotypha africana]KAI8975154.1 hypothetical protein BDF20DRAFT_589080 [Mycotypha africana]
MLPFQKRPFSPHPRDTSLNTISRYLIMEFTPDGIVDRSFNDPFRFRIAPELAFTTGQLEALQAILDTFIAPLPQHEEDALVQKFRHTHTEEEVRAFCRLSSSSLQTLDSVKAFIHRTVIPEKRQDFIWILSLLSSKAGTFALTGHFQTFKDLSIEDREKVFLSWKDSFLSPLRLLYKTFHSLACHPAYATHAKVLGDAMHYNRYIDKARKQVYTDLPERFPMLQPEDLKENMEYDVIIVGSGAGGGVVASQLAQAGKSVLVIEKGSYYHESEFIPEESAAFQNLYENGGFSVSYEGAISNLAGSVFGGGTTVNWSACLKLQHFVREEWAKQGLSYFNSPTFAKDLDRVFEVIGASTENIVHNGSNQVLIDGCRALGYPVADIAQNTSGKPHTCEFCFTGCRAGIKNGTMNSWLRNAYNHGAQFLVQTKANRIVTEKIGEVRRAVGIECFAHYNRDKTIYIRAREQVIVSAGSLQSPGLLLRSGLTNPHIGHHLHLHPCSITFGFFDGRKKEVNTFQGSIMTAVSGVAEDVDHEGYGAKLEVPCLHPGSYSTVLPWRGAAAHKELMLKYSYCAPILILSRDKDSVGRVRYDENDNVMVDFNLSNHDRRSILAGIEKSLNVLVAAGARELHTGQFGVQPFVFREEEESRVDNHRFISWKQKVLKYGLPPNGAGIFSAHQMGSNRMGISPKVSAVKPTGETWEVKDLYVADASVFPTSSGVNPMVTTEAIALHIADCIISKQNNNSARL